MRHSRHAFSNSRRAFSLLEVMISAAIMVVALAIMVNIQAGAVRASVRAEKLMVATNLAQEKLATVKMTIECAGMPTNDQHEQGDFDRFGDGADLDYKVQDYKWEYWVEEIDFSLGGDLMSMLGGGGDDDDAGGNSMGQEAMESGALSGLGLSDDMLSDTLNKYIRRLRVRVYWGEERDAEEQGREIVLTTHMVNPKGGYLSMDPNGPDAGGSGGAGGGGGEAPPGFSCTIGEGIGGDSE
ncbi:MAG: prepilin-type N-terminal cleavage/methylation domain-containing protein [Kiritimatiellia bacterium]|jgi:prepilin-type N-terminal cleavage/methylation domain-containing protein